MKYSKTTGGFYEPEIHGNNIPEDAKELTLEQYESLLRGLVSGKEIVADENGDPYLRDPLPSAPPSATPSAVSRFQARTALWQAGLYEAVENYMNDPSTPMPYKFAWQDAQTFERQSDTVAVLQNVLGLSNEQVDELFLQASKITA